MRLHHLEIVAFGPFAEPVEIDFDHLSDAGLFLLSGATGAGKTSVLDAVCFALYGDVPGDRAAAKRLRCDQAPPGLAPSVAMEATLSGRRFRLVRSPAWERPKKRGTGTTTQQASVSISERVDGAWQPLTSRLDEAGHLVGRLLGMNLPQFTQVAMLPQGRFQAFLRARSEERHKLLQQLFRTGRFEQVERWLRERRTALRRDCDTAHLRVSELVSRVSEVADTRLPEAWDPHDLSHPAESGELWEWVEGLAEQAVERASAAAAEADILATDEAAARDRVAEARRRLERRSRVSAAQATLSRLDADEATRTDLERDLEASRRARPVQPARRLAAQARAEHQRAGSATASADEEACTVLDLLFVDIEVLTQVEQSAAEAAAAVRAALPREQRLLEVQQEMAAAGRRLDALHEQAGERRGVLATLPRRVEELRERLRQVAAAGDRVTALETTLAGLRERGTAAREAERLAVELEQARSDWLVAREETLSRQEVLLDIRQARIDGMAAELAGALAVGACCPVCGSADHPSKASASPGSPDADAEKTAQRGLDDAKATEHARDQRVRDLSTQLAVTTERAGNATAAETEERCRECVDELAALRAEAAGADRLEAELAELDARLTRTRTELGELEQDAGALEASRAHLLRDLDALRSERDALIGDSGCPDLAGLLGDHERRVEVARRARRGQEQLAAAAAALAEAERVLADALVEAGFADEQAAAEALLTTEEEARLTARLREAADQRAAATAVLAEADEDLLDGPAPDLPALVAEHAAALDGLGAARTATDRWRLRADRLGRLVAGTAEALEAWRPLRADLDLTAGLAAFVEGRAADNTLQMRLSAYVLAYRLGQVVAAANERLERMSDRRYSLEHTGRRGVGETRGGLSLTVRDAWSGEARDPATLSGGETFVVSLALALGLADVITQEAGGADVDTLFVDEGFGSLDADTLDDVMDTLDALRDGGRVVGVVSHVAEMRDRIPTQLVVGKSRLGSTVSVTR